jgi:hypothetical protein
MLRLLHYRYGFTYEFFHTKERYMTQGGTVLSSVF